MTVLFDVTHPAHVHLFRNAIDELEAADEDVVVAAREKDLTTDLLEAYDIAYTVLSERQNGVLSLVVEWPLREVKTLRFYWSVDPDVVVSRFNPAASHASWVLDIPHLVFDDSESKPAFVRKAANPFSDVIYTPECFTIDLGDSQVRYPGYHELAYLHPDRFEPDPKVVERLGVEADRYAVLRLVSWDAVHDVGHGGFKSATELMSTLESAGVTPVITAEGDLPKRLQQYQIDVPVHEIHHVLYYADLFVGESATMATESAVLGTPAIFVSSIRCGYTDEIEADYGLVFNYSGENRHERSLKKAQEILSSYDPTKWSEKRDILLNEKIDTTNLILGQISEASSR